MPALTRGPLPARVYWVRRLLVLGVALLLVFGIARLLGGGSDATSGSSGSSGSSDDAAQLAADGSPSTSSELSESSYPTRSAGPGKTKHSSKASQKPTLAQPEGTCADEDIAVTPAVDDAVAGRDVRVVLQLRTLESEACTWQVSPQSLTVSITSGKDDIWSSQECPKAIPTKDVVVRRAATTKVAFIWHEAKRSDETCSNRTDWAMPGWYHVTAAALAGEPSDVQFQLTTPTPETVTKTATPKQRARERQRG